MDTDAAKILGLGAKAKAGLVGPNALVPRTSPFPENFSNAVLKLSAYWRIAASPVPYPAEDCGFIFVWRFS